MGLVGRGLLAVRWRRGVPYGRAHTRPFILISSFFLTLINSAGAYRAGFTNPTLKASTRIHTHDFTYRVKSRATRPRRVRAVTRQCRKLNDHPLRAPFVSSASFDYYTPKYLCPPPLKTAIKSSDLRCTRRGAVRLSFAILFRRQKLSRDRNYNFFWDRPA